MSALILEQHSRCPQSMLMIEYAVHLFSADLIKSNSFRQIYDFQQIIFLVFILEHDVRYPRYVIND